MTTTNPPATGDYRHDQARDLEIYARHDYHGGNEL